MARTIEINHREIMDAAKASLEGVWNNAALVIFVYVLIIAAVSSLPFASSLASLIISGPFGLGIAIFSLKLSNNETTNISDIFEGFKNFVPALLTYLIMVAVVTIGLVLFIVPGIILAFGLSQAMFILSEEPEMPAADVLRKSWEMMKGYKMDYFILSIRFLPWAILCIFTLGIGFLWLLPYIYTTFANFYKKISGDNRFEEDDILDHLVE